MMEMGLAGVSFSVLLVESTFCACFYGYRYFMHLNALSESNDNIPIISLQIIKKIIGLGLPIGLQFSGELTAITIALYMMGLFVLAGV